jgi:hypothetical protein
MAENKTKPSDISVHAFIEAVPDSQRRADAWELCALLEQVTREPPVMWGSSIVGFGRYHYRYDSGREGDAAALGFSPRAKELVVYLSADARDKDALLARLGKHRTGKSCLYIKSLADVDLEVLRDLAAGSLAAIRQLYPGG